MGHAMASADTAPGTRVVAERLEDLHVRHARGAVGCRSHHERRRHVGGMVQGIYTSETGDTVTSLLVGGGDHAGPSSYRWEYKQFGLTWQTEGLIFPGTIPSP